MTASRAEGRRAKNRRLKRSAALDAAMAVIDDEGIDGLTIQRLAKQLDWAAGALYRYFPSKDALLIALQARILGEYDEDRRRALARVNDPLTALVVLGRHFHTWFAAHRPQFSLVAMSLSHPRQLIDDQAGAAHFSHVIEVLQDIVDIFRRAGAVGALHAGDPVQRMLVYWSSLMGALQLTKLQRVAPHLLDGRALVHSAARSLLLGWGAQVAHVDAAFAKELPC